MDSIDFSLVEIKNGFWKEKLDMVRNTTVFSVYNRFKDTHRFSALECKWKEGDDNVPHVFWDSDVAKWIEGASYLLQFEDIPELEEKIENAIDNFIKNSDENGYFNSHFLVVDKEKRFKDRNMHELYCLGHWIEAAVAYKNATGKGRFLKAVCKYTDYVERVFKIENSADFVTPGHPELELALFKLYKATGEKRYLELGKYFIQEHGKKAQNLAEAFIYPYNQDDMLLKDRTTIDGHSVRALYLYSGVADIAKETNDTELIEACKRIYENAVSKRMYITGGVGSTYIGEAFTVDYDLPNRTAYAETCAAIALALFSQRMLKIEENAKYADTVERVIYNGFLSGVSMDGKSFFYENPLEIDPGFNDINKATKEKTRFPITQRLEVFNCSCCPPNVVRFIPSVSGFVFGENEDTIFVNQYIDCTASYGNSKITLNTEYPKNGSVKLNYSGNKKYVAFRIPQWCREYSIDCEYELKNGYAYVSVDGKTEINIDFLMPVTLISANRRVHDNAGRIAVMRGPVVYCIEGVDNGKDLKTVSIKPDVDFTLIQGEFILPNIKTVGYRPTASDDLYSFYNENYEEFELTLIPYYAFANRGTTEMNVWILKG